METVINSYSINWDNAVKLKSKNEFGVRVERVPAGSDLSIKINGVETPIKAPEDGYLTTNERGQQEFLNLYEFNQLYSPLRLPTDNIPLINDKKIESYKIFAKNQLFQKSYDVKKGDYLVAYTGIVTVVPKDKFERNYKIEEFIPENKRSVSNNENIKFTPISTSSLDWSKAYWAQEDKKIIAEFIPAGQEFKTKMQSEAFETTEKAGVDGAYRVTQGENIFKMSKHTFEAMYDAEAVKDKTGPKEYKSHWDPIMVLPGHKHISISNPKEGERKVRAGAVLAKKESKPASSTYDLSAEKFKKDYKILGKVSEMARPNSREDYENYLKTKGAKRAERE